MWLKENTHLWCLFSFSVHENPEMDFTWNGLYFPAILRCFLHPFVLTLSLNISYLLCLQTSWLMTWLLDSLRKESEKQFYRLPRHLSTVLCCSVMSDSLWCCELWSTKLFCPWNYPGKNTGVGCHFLLQGIFLTQGSNPCLLGFLHWQADSFRTESPGKPIHLSTPCQKNILPSLLFI